MMRIISLWSIVLVALGLTLVGCGERGEWMKEEAAGTEGVSNSETASARGQDQSGFPQEGDGN